MVCDQKVFIIGFNKCGTRSLDYFFKKHGFQRIHWHEGRLANDIDMNIQCGRKPLEGYEGYNCFSDMEDTNRVDGKIIEAYKYFREFDQAYPGSMFLLNTRPTKNWIASRHRNQKKQYWKRYAAYYGLETKEEVNRLWINQWNDHHQKVTEYFSTRSAQLLVFDIENDNPRKLTIFCENFFLRPFYSKFYKHLR